MKSIDEIKGLMTIFYSTNTGKIMTIAGGVQTMDIYGEDKKDFNYNTLVIKIDEYLIDNQNKFIVSEDKIKIKEEYKESISKYL